MIHFLYFVKKILLNYYEAKTIDDFMIPLISKYYSLLSSAKRSGVKKRKEKNKLIVSLTTIPERIDNVWITVESLLRQTYRPDEIILWLSKEEFQNQRIPLKLKQQQKRGLKIRYCDNIRSYKKFYYTVKENPDAYVITVDDDIVYSENLIKYLVKAYKKYPNCIICTRSHVIKKRNGNLLPYNSWKRYEKREKICSKPSFLNFFTSGAGTLFPMRLMSQELLDKNTFMKVAPTADDVWLNFIAWKSGLKTVNIEGALGNIICFRNSSVKDLYRENVNKQKNDIQIKKVLEYLEIDISKYI